MTGPAKTSRRAAPLSAARLAAVQALYQMDMVGTDSERVIMEFVEHRLGDDVEDAEFHRADPAFFRQLVEGVVSGQSRIDPLLNDCLSEGWRLARIDSILRATLRAAAFEMLERSEVPARVVITEYVDVAHAFLDGDNPKVVNGILDRLARMLRQGELGEAASA